MAKILIIYPPGWIRLHPLHPLGTAMLASILHSKGIECTQVDLDIFAYDMNRTCPQERLQMEDLVDPSVFRSFLEKNGNLNKLYYTHRSVIERLLSSVALAEVKAVAFSIMGERQFISSTILSAFFRDLGIPTMAGGCYISDHYDRISSLQIFDAIFKGFAEDEFIRTCQKLLLGNFKARAMKVSVDHEAKYDLNSQPKPLFSHELNENYRRSLRAMYKTKQEHLVLQYLTDIGCRYGCSFCIRFHKKYQKKTVPKIIREMKEISVEYSTNLFSIVSNAINIDLDFSLDLFREMSHNLGNLEWYAYAYPNLNDPKLTELIARSGCKMLRFGLESASSKVLKILNKKFTPTQAAKAFKLVHSNGIWVQVNIMVGCPHENESDIEETCRFIEKYHPYIDSIRINPFYLQVNSSVHRRPSYYGIKVRPQKDRVIGFDEVGGLDWESKVVQTIRSVDKIYLVMKQFGIGYYGISSNLLLCALRENQSIENTKEWLAQAHPYMCDNISFEGIRWKIYHGHEMDKSPYGEDWKSVYGLTFEEDIR